jgi:hypothetical protein
MSKHKTVTHVPAAPAPSPPAAATPAPRLAVQLLTVLGELVVVVAAVLGIVTAVTWALAGMDRTRIARQPQRPTAEWVCWGRSLRRDLPVCGLLAWATAIFCEVLAGGEENRQIRYLMKVLSRTVPSVPDIPKALILLDNFMGQRHVPWGTWHCPVMGHLDRGRDTAVPSISPCLSSSYFLWEAVRLKIGLA